MGEPRLVQGNEACALGALAAGCRFYAGYPITPSSEIAEVLARRLPGVGGVFVQMEDEIASLAACLGASLAGWRAMTATSGPGFSLMQEHIGFAAMAELPVVIVDVMRGGPSTGLPTAPSQGDLQQARWGSHGDRPALVLAPSSVREVFDLTAAAFQHADTLRMPVVVLYDAVIAHLHERVDLPEELTIAPRPTPPPGPYLPYAARNGATAPLAAFGGGRRFHVTGLAHDEQGFPTTDPQVVDRMQRRLHQKVEAARDVLPDCERVMLDDADVAVVAVGIAARAARAAVRAAREQGVRAGLLRPITLWPFADAAVRETARHVSRLIIAEMSLGQLRAEVDRVVGGRVEVEGCQRVDGEPLAPDQILSTLTGAGVAAR